jgi:hypothetical protein
VFEEGYERAFAAAFCANNEYTIEGSVTGIFVFEALPGILT